MGICAATWQQWLADRNLFISNLEGSGQLMIGLIGSQDNGQLTRMINAIQTSGTRLMSLLRGHIATWRAGKSFFRSFIPLLEQSKLQVGRSWWKFVAKWAAGNMRTRFIKPQAKSNGSSCLLWLLLSLLVMMMIIIICPLISSNEPASMKREMIVRAKATGTRLIKSSHHDWRQTHLKRAAWISSSKCPHGRKNLPKSRLDRIVRPCCCCFVRRVGLARSTCIASNPLQFATKLVAAAAPAADKLVWPISSFHLRHWAETAALCGWRLYCLLLLQKIMRMLVSWSKCCLIRPISSEGSSIGAFNYQARANVNMANSSLANLRM